jgi:hypothetical protein
MSTRRGILHTSVACATMATLLGACADDGPTAPTSRTPAPDPLFHIELSLGVGDSLNRPALVGEPIPGVEVTYQGCAAGCDTTYTGDVTLVLGTSPAGSSLGGTATVPMIHGVAVFADLSVDQEGVYSLVATAPGAAPDTSAAFRACAQSCWEWSRAAAMPTPRSLPGVGVVGATLYAIGGLDTIGAPSAAVEAYDPATDTWTSRAPMPTARYGFGIGVVDDIVYVAGGITASGATAGVEAYDPATDTWSTRASLPSPTGFPAAGGLDGLLYLVGGQQADSTIVATVLAYDPGTDQWSSRAPLPLPRSLAGLGVSDGLLYVMGGQTDPETWADVSVPVYDPVTDRWVTRTVDPSGQGRWYGGPLLPAVGVLPGRGIVVAGGSDGTNGYLTDPYGIGEIYDPAGSRYHGHMWVPVMFRWDASPIVSLPSAGVVKGELYLVGYETYRFIGLAMCASCAP